MSWLTKVHNYTSKIIDYEKQDPDIQREIDRHGTDRIIR